MLTIEIREGDISRCEADALVNAANNRLWMGSGVAGALKRVGGREVEEEAMKKGPISIGEAISTGAGRLEARYVIHAAVMGQDLRTDAVIIKKATENSLRRADELGCKSIAFPALGTGVGGFSLEECARLMIGVVREYAMRKTELEKVIFVLYGEPAYRVFQEELDRGKK
ncbi:MAG: macro domain-containing protein [Dehalococcoidales bacterium]|nr:macro domain-containing protein [Dehalococcoidales bacterium]